MNNSRTKHWIGALVVGGLLSLSAHADSDRLFAPQLNLYKQECAACHMAYPPGLLPASSWMRVMRGLDKHYGVNASLDDESLQTLTAYLTQYAGQGRRSEATANDRITESRWFARKHREFSARDWAHPQIKSAANCMACHTGAERGDFEEDRVRLPKGVGGWTKRLWGDDD